MNSCLLLLFIIFFGTQSTKAQCAVPSTNMNLPKISNMQRYQNVSTAPSAIKLLLKDTQTEQTFNVVVRNDDFFYFLQHIMGFDYAKYVDFMIRKDGSPIEIDVQSFKEYLWKRWNVKKKYREGYFINKVTFEKEVTLKELEVANEKQILEKYFNCQETGPCTLKVEYYERYNQAPAFLALLINLGYGVYWGDIAPVLSISTANSK